MAFKFANEIIDEIKAKELEIPIGSVSGEEFEEWLCTERREQMTREEIKHFANCLKNNYTIDFNDMEDFCNAVIESQNKLERIENIIKGTENVDFIVFSKDYYFNKIVEVMYND